MGPPSDISAVGVVRFMFDPSPEVADMVYEVRPATSGSIVRVRVVTLYEMAVSPVGSTKLIGLFAA
jgi:hypothetical protein